MVVIAFKIIVVVTFDCNVLLKPYVNVSQGAVASLVNFVKNLEDKSLSRPVSFIPCRSPQV